MVRNSKLEKQISVNGRHKGRNNDRRNDRNNSRINNLVNRPNNSRHVNVSTRIMAAAIGIVLSVAAGVFAVKVLPGLLSNTGKPENGSGAAAGADAEAVNAAKTGITAGVNDLVISKGELTETVRFFPVNADGANMEIMAVRASDGSVRTAFNTCQVCNGSPRAYYKQQSDRVICQNCGNIFRIDMIEQQRGGCNPIPIMKENKTDDGENIIISGEFLKANKAFFPSNWKTR